MGATGTVVRGRASHQCGPGSILDSELSLLVLYSAPRGFFPGTPIFPSPQEVTFDFCIIFASLLDETYI